MKKIYKYPLEVAGGWQEVVIPCNARIVHVDVQYSKICLWALVETMNETEIRTFTIKGTGQSIGNDSYIGSVQMPPYVWHVLEVG